VNESLWDWQMNKHTDFRRWLYELWMQNCDEHDMYHQPRFSQEEYFQMYKYWLKREFRHQQKHGQ
jgi:hypothetical protein